MTNEKMSIIESIKNGARFRHKDGKLPEEWHVFNNGRLVVYWEGNIVTHIYKDDGVSEHIELIPEEETLWVVIPKCGSGLGHPNTEQEATHFGDSFYGPGNYTIHSITRTK